MSDEIPSWLPDPLCLEPWREDTYDKLYKIFCRDFKNPTPLYFRNEKIIIFSQSHHLKEGKEKVFWHITDKEDGNYSDRLPDLRRAERINWIKPIIQNYTSPDIYCFDYVESSKKKNTYLWLYKYDFVVILQRLDKINYIIITAFYISYESKRRELLDKYKKNCNK